MPPDLFPNTLFRKCIKFASNPSDPPPLFYAPVFYNHTSSFIRRIQEFVQDTKWHKVPLSGEDTKWHNVCN